MHISTKTAKRIIALNIWVVLLVLTLALFSAIHRAHQYDGIFLRVGKQQGLDPRLISAVAWKESRYHAEATGKVGEVGLMQIMEPAVQEWASAQKVSTPKKIALYHPMTNVMVGAWYLSKALQKWSHKEDPLPYALAQYNAGRSRALKWDQPQLKTSRLFWENIPFPSTKKYIQDILIRYRGKI